MGSRQADSEALVMRCKRAGWRVVRGARGYKVYDGANMMHTIHLTYSDIKSLLNSEQELLRAGLAEAEKAIETARLTESRTRNDVARQAAEVRGKQLAASASLARAAGPYLVDVENVDISWLIEPHPAPWVRWVNITPDMAAKVLADHNGDNRPLDQGTVKHYRDIILAGMWHLTHQGAAFDVRGMLQDGQHRFAAIGEAAKLSPEPVVVPMAVFVGMALENFKAIDEGRLRTAQQLFAKDGEKNTTILQTAVRLVYYHLDGDARRAARLRLPNQVILDEFAANVDAYRDSVRWGAAAARVIRGTSAAALSAAHYLIRRVNGADNDYVVQFFEALTTGWVPGSRIALDDDDPRAAFRNKMAVIKDKVTAGQKGERRSALTQVGMIIATWNNMVNSRRIRLLVFNDATAIPEVLKCLPGEGGVPAMFLSPKARQGDSQ